MFYDKFNDDTSWDDLDRRTQDQILDSNVQFLGSFKKLKDCLQACKSGNFRNILNQTLSSKELFDLLKRDSITLAHNPVPQVPKYYIPRLLCISTQDDKVGFRENYSNTFVMDETKKSDCNLTVNARYQVGNTAYRVTALDIPLDNEQSTTCLLNDSDRPQTKRGTDVFSKKTHRSLELTQRQNFPEQEIISHIDTKIVLEAPICIADNTGTGKTVLLANQCTNILKRGSSDLALYFGFADLMSNMENLDVLTANMDAFMHAVANITGCTQLGAEILYQTLMSDDQKLHFFLNSYDEIPAETLELANVFLNCLMKHSDRIKIYVSTRIHRREELENVLGKPSYGIVPLNFEEQRMFLERYWHYQFGIPDTENLSEFANLLLTSAGTRIEQDNFGIPLQCAMLGEIYAEDAKAYANESKKSNVSIDTHSIYYMYKKLVENKIRKRKSGILVKLKQAHLIVAINLLNPKLLTEELLGIEVVDPLLEDIARSGLINTPGGIKSLTDQNCHFTYQIFGDFILADYLVDSIFSLDKHSQLYGINLLVEGLRMDETGKHIKIHTFGERGL